MCKDLNNNSNRTAQTDRVGSWNLEEHAIVCVPDRVQKKSPRWMKLSHNPSTANIFDGRQRTL